MPLDLEQLGLLGLLTSATHWIIARAEISQPLWGRARGWFARLLACPGCSGFWLGIAFGAAGVRPTLQSWPVIGSLTSGLCAVFLTPVFEGVLLWGLERSAIEAAEDDSSPRVPPLPGPAQPPRP